jgi:hypothetical protein
MREGEMNLKKLMFWQTEQDVLPLATSHEQIAGDICVQLGHLSETAKDEILKLVVAKALPGKAVYVSRKKEAQIEGRN